MAEQIPFNVAHETPQQENHQFVRNRLLNRIPLGLLGVLLSANFTFAPAEDAPSLSANDPSRYNIVWNSPSKDAFGSMPLGNGDICLNAWIEQDGDLRFYISKTDAWDEYARLVKVGRVRVALNPNPFLKGNTYQQTLDLKNGEMIVKAAFEDGTPLTMNLWVDANHPVVHVSVDSEKEVAATASIDLWRTEPKKINTENGDPTNGTAIPMIIEPDTLLKEQQGRIGWYHHNHKSVGPELTMKMQGLADVDYKDIMLDRTFGVVIEAENATRENDATLKLPAAKQQQLNLHVLTKHPAKPEAWLAAIEQLITDTNSNPLAQRKQQHAEWWRQFWDRSWIHFSEGSEAVQSAKSLNRDSNAYRVSRGYQLQRYLNSCAGRGEFPIKFNGSLFTVPYPKKPGDADFRRWGTGYWWQNTRLAYAGACAAGDAENLKGFFGMYTGEFLEVCKHRTQKYFGHGGAFYPECVYPWGAVTTRAYGTEPYETRKDKLQSNAYHKWEWIAGGELVFMMLDYYEHTGDSKFLKETILPTAMEVIKFFDEHYKANAQGELVMHPAMACETWWDCTNPMPELAALYVLTQRLLAMPDTLVSADDKKFYAQLRKKLPPLPTREVGGGEAYAPATKYENKRNTENPELYVVFPYRLCSFEKENVELGRMALKHRWNQGASGWRQDDIFMAYLGLDKQAWGNVSSRAANSDKVQRFPAFWGPNNDWTPDQCHGGVLVKTAQAMVMQTEGTKIFLKPALPDDINAEFKLHAPYQTTVEGRIVSGKIVDLKVTPESRRKDIVEN